MLFAFIVMCEMPGRAPVALEEGGQVVTFYSRRVALAEAAAMRVRMEGGPRCRYRVVSLGRTNQ